MDLNEEAFTNRLTLRRFFVLAAGLPWDSAYQRFLRDKKNRDLIELNDMEETFQQIGGG